MSALPRRGDPLRALARPSGLAALAVTAIAALLTVQAADGPWLTELGRAIASAAASRTACRTRRRPPRAGTTCRCSGSWSSRCWGRSAAADCRSPRWRPWPGRSRCWRATRGAPARKERALAIALLLLLPACFGPIVAIRAQLFSLPLFAACVLLLRSESRAPSNRIWLLVPLFALWGNLHGAVLTGAAVAGAYLIFERARHRPGESIAVMAASRARPVRQSRALAHAVIRARRAAQRGRAPGHRTVGAAQPAQLARCRLRACRGGAAGGRPARAPARVGARGAGRARAADAARGARRHVARALRRPARSRRVRRPGAPRAHPAPRPAGRAGAARRGRDRRRARAAAERRLGAARHAHA